MREYKNRAQRDASHAILDQMSKLRGEEKESEKALLREWYVNKSIPYAEFKRRERKLHDEAQAGVDALYKKMEKL